MVVTWSKLAEVDVLTILVWLLAFAGVILLGRLRGSRAVVLLALCLILITISVIAWNSYISYCPR